MCTFESWTRMLTECVTAVFKTLQCFFTARISFTDWAWLRIAIVIGCVCNAL